MIKDLSCSITGGLFETYEDYLFSDIWLERKNEFLEAYNNCYICKVVKLHREQQVRKKNGRLILWWVSVGKPFVVHHKTYENVGNEKRKDLIVICRDCHAEIHNKKDKEEIQI